MSDLTVAGITYMTLLAFQFGMQPILAREYNSKDLVKTSLVLSIEGSKFVVSLIAMLISGQTTEALKGWTLAGSVKAAGAPAVVYAFQNIMIQTAYANMDGLTFNLMNQTKILFTAICLYVIMGKKQSMMQCLGLLGLFSASVILSQAKAEVGGKVTSFQFGVVPNIIASMCSGIASALSQLSLQGDRRNSFLFTMELAVFSTISLLISLTYTDDGVAIAENGFFHGWTPSCLIPMMSSSCGGVLVGLVIANAGGVRKGFSIIGGILLTGIAQFFLYNAPLSNEMVMALPIVLISTFFHIKFPYVEKEEKKKEKKSE